MAIARCSLANQPFRFIASAVSFRSCANMPFCSSLSSPWRDASSGAPKPVCGDCCSRLVTYPSHSAKNLGRKLPPSFSSRCRRNSSLRRRVVGEVGVGWGGGDWGGEEMGIRGGATRGLGCTHITYLSPSILMSCGSFFLCCRRIIRNSETALGVELIALQSEAN